MPFTKMHGLGNDYVYLDEREVEVGDVPAWSRILSDRHRAIGSDGLIILRRDPEHACRMEMVNADGSRAEMCGNGIRCVARLARERGYVDRDRFTIATDAGVLEAEVDLSKTPVQVRVDMGRAKIVESNVTLIANGQSFTGSIVDVGNPHFVIPISVSPQSVPLETVGPILEHDERFPHRANIEFVCPTNRTSIEFRVWERGSGETRACGTGATAAAAALRALDLVDSISTVHLLGGDLTIEVGDDGRCWMTGPAEESFRGTFPRSLIDG
ncbi:MAG: diaminopimelate epimerase [Planctomycetota bacterium]